MRTWRCVCSACMTPSSSWMFCTKWCVAWWPSGSGKPWCPSCAASQKWSSAPTPTSSFSTTSSSAAGPRSSAPLCPKPNHLWRLASLNWTAPHVMWICCTSFAGCTARTPRRVWLSPCVRDCRWTGGWTCWSCVCRSPYSQGFTLLSRPSITISVFTIRYGSAWSSMHVCVLENEFSWTWFGWMHVKNSHLNEVFGWSLNLRTFFFFFRCI